MKILAAIDRSDYAERVLDLTCRLAKPGATQVLVMHAAPREPDVFGRQIVRKVFTDPVPEELADRKDMLDRAAARLEEAGIACETLLLRGKPATNILREAKSWGADMIVVGSHGRGMLYRQTLGSVSEEVVREGSLPVLVVPVQPGEH
jgi:nucleotide-binding universal stress UspA family protein